MANRSNNIQMVANTITERPMLIWLGIIPIIVRPLTLAQIYDIGAEVEKIEEVDITGEFNPIIKMLQRYEDIAVCTEITKICLFRKRWKRWLFGRIIRNHLTMSMYNRIIEYSAQSFGASFFLTSFTFLKGTKEVTKPTNTEEATASGDSSED